MSSQLASIISTIAGQSIGGVAGLDLAQLPESVDSWRFPVRLVLPVGGGRAQGQLQRVATFKSSGAGGVLVVDWTISDILFYRGADSGVGLADVAPALIAHCAAAMTTLGALRNAKWGVTALTFPIIGPFEWPAGGRTYDGVQAQLTIREII